MIKKFLVLLLVCLPMMANAQSVQVRSEGNNEGVQNLVELNTFDTKPQFNGGDPAKEFAKYIAQNKVYPQNCKWSKIEGTVLVSFVVTEEGKVTDVKVLRSSDSPELDAEAVRVVKTSPDWSPAKQAGNPMPMTFTFPVEFKL